jgi:tryptophan synthase beta subunit
VPAKLRRDERMSIENVQKFYEAVNNDETLRQKLTEFSRKYQGEATE